MNDWLGEFISHAGFLLRARGNILIWPVSERGPLTLRLRCVVWNIGSGEFDLCLLLRCEVCGRVVSGERVKKILLVLLLNGGRKRYESRKGVICYGKGLLR